MFTALLAKAKVLGILGVVGGSIAFAAPSASARGFDDHRVVLSPTVSYASVATPVCYPDRTIVHGRGFVSAAFGHRNRHHHHFWHRHTGQRHDDGGSHRADQGHRR